MLAEGITLKSIKIDCQASCRLEALDFAV